jgi:hypothetical protein
MNTLRYKLFVMALGAVMMVSDGRLQAEELESRVVKDSQAVDDELVPPQVPVAPTTIGPIADDEPLAYRPVRFYRRPFYRGWGPGHYMPYRSYYYPNPYGYYYYGGPRYYNYYGTPRFGYYDYPYGGTARVGPRRFFWR